jgi:hypothetical protein
LDRALNGAHHCKIGLEESREDFTRRWGRLFHHAGRLTFKCGHADRIKAMQTAPAPEHAIAKQLFVACMNGIQRTEFIEIFLQQRQLLSGDDGRAWALKHFIELVRLELAGGLRNSRVTPTPDLNVDPRAVAVPGPTPVRASPPSVTNHTSHSTGGVEHADDFTWLKVGESTYEFSKGQQANTVGFLFAQWERSGRHDGCGASEQTICEVVDSANRQFRILHAFRNSKALHTILGRSGKGVWALFLNEPRSRSPKNPRRIHSSKHTSRTCGSSRSAHGRSRRTGRAGNDGPPASGAGRVAQG